MVHVQDVHFLYRVEAQAGESVGLHAEADAFEVFVVLLREHTPVAIAPVGEVAALERAHLGIGRAPFENPRVVDRVRRVASIGTCAEDDGAAGVHGPDDVGEHEHVVDAGHLVGCEARHVEAP